MTRADSPFGAPAHAAVGSSHAAAAAGAISLPRGNAPGAVDGNALGRALRNPREAVRDPRVLLGGVLIVGLVILAVSLLGPGNQGGAAGDPVASTPPVAATLPPPTGTAAFEIEGRTTRAFTLAGATGAGPAVDDRIDATWADGLGNDLALAGRAGSGTRKTSGELVLTLTAVLGGSPVTFTSRTGECTVGMASQPRFVTGSFVCKEFESVDGEHVIDVSGTYRT